MIPAQNPGIDWPRRAIVMPTLSKIVPRLIAEMMPRGRAMQTERSVPAKQR